MSKGWSFSFTRINLCKSQISSFSCLPCKRPHAGLLAPPLWGVPSGVWWGPAHERLALASPLVPNVFLWDQRIRSEHMSEQLPQLQTGLSTPKNMQRDDFPPSRFISPLWVKVNGLGVSEASGDGGLKRMRWAGSRFPRLDLCVHNSWMETPGTVHAWLTWKSWQKLNVTKCHGNRFSG